MLKILLPVSNEIFHSPGRRKKREEEEGRGEAGEPPP